MGYEPACHQLSGLTHEAEALVAWTWNTFGGAPNQSARLDKQGWTSIFAVPAVFDDMTFVGQMLNVCLFDALQVSWSGLCLRGSNDFGQHTRCWEAGK